MLPRAADLLVIDDLEGLKRVVGIPAPAWAGFVSQVGDPGTHHLAALPPFPRLVLQLHWLMEPPSILSKLRR